MSGKRAIDYIRCGVMLLLLLPLLWMNPQKANAAEHTFTFFYNNSCASCREDEDIYEMFNRCFSSAEKEKMDYEVLVYNAFVQSGRELYEQYCIKYGQEAQEEELFPVLAVDGAWVCGYGEIEDYLKNDFKKVAEDEAEAAGPEDEAVGPKDEAAELDSGKTSGNTKPDEALSAFLEELERDLQSQDPLVLLFTTYNCGDCEKVKEFLKTSDYDGTVREYNIGEADTVEVLRSLYSVYQVEEKRQRVPAVFAGDQVFTGKEEIMDGLSGKPDAGTLLSFVNSHINADTIKASARMDYITLFFSGLLAGFNPCGISMLLMLLTILLTSGTNVLKNGLLYTGAKIITYLGIGIGAYFAVSAVFSEGMQRISRIVTSLMAFLLLVLAIFNFMDFWSARHKEYGKIRMQLPKGLRRFNHNLIKKMNRVSKHGVPFLALGLGVIISLGEFFCTGQIYMASILYMLRSEVQETGRILMMFAVYVGAMMIPTIVVLLIIHKTRSANRVSEFMLHHMDVIKLFNGILFLAFFSYLLLSIL